MDQKHIEELRRKYIQNPPEGMSNDDLLDMDYFLHEDDDLDDEIGEEGFYLF